MIHLITGMQGSGKTLFLVKRAYEGYKQGKTIYSNIALNFPYKRIDYNDIVQCRYKNALVIIDEIHQLLPSRRAMSEININIVDSFLSQVRKQGLEVYGSTQTQRKVDVRFREEADYIYLCERWCYIESQWKQITNSEYVDKKIPVMITMMTYQSFSGMILKSNFIGNPYFELYDTTQIIQVTGIERTAKGRNKE